MFSRPESTGLIPAPSSISDCTRPRIVSVPEIMRGKDELMRKTRIRHSLVLEITTPQGAMFTQLHFAADAPIEVSAEPQTREAFQMF